MIAVGVYRFEATDGVEIAKVILAGDASELGEINREAYEENGCKPPFDSLPTKEDHEADS